MKYPDYMEYYLAIAIGLDRHRAVNVYGKTLNMTTFPEQIYSTSELDTMTVVVEGLDIGFNEVSLGVELQGLKPISIEGMSRINCMKVDKVNDGMIVCNDYNIEPGKMISQYSNYSIGNNETGYITNIHGKDVSLLIRNIEEENGYAEYDRIDGEHYYKVPYKVRPYSDIKLVSENNSGMQLILIQEE